MIDSIHCGALHFEFFGGIGKHPSIWLNLDFLKSLGPKKWENAGPLDSEDFLQKTVTLINIKQTS